MIVYLSFNSKLSKIKYQFLNNEEEGGECEQKLLGDEESQETFECCPNEKLLKLTRIGKKSSYILLMMLVTVTGFPMVLKPDVVRWAANHARMFYQECGQKAKSIMQGAAYGCEPLYPSGNTELCKGNFTHFEERIRKEKPDYAFIFTRFMSIGAPFPKHVTTFEQDPIYQVTKGQMLKFISNIKYKLFILDSIPRINRKIIEEIVPLMRNHTALKEIDV
ncbi:hypothetical protein CAEBREN_31060, partial [Caenorhabditis brenneri]